MEPMATISKHLTGMVFIVLSLIMNIVNSKSKMREIKISTIRIAPKLKHMA